MTKPMTANQTADFAINLWNNGFYCGESVLSAVAAQQGIESDLIPKIATAFGSGVAETGSTCGALNGAILGLSMALGRTQQDDDRTQLYEKTQRLVTAFKDKFDSTNCPELIQLQLGTPEASEEYRQRGLSAQCETYIHFAAQMAAELLQEDD